MRTYSWLIWFLEGRSGKSRYLKQNSWNTGSRIPMMWSTSDVEKGQPWETISLVLYHVGQAGIKLVHDIFTSSIKSLVLMWHINFPLIQQLQGQQYEYPSHLGHVFLNTVLLNILTIMETFAWKLIRDNNLKKVGINSDGPICESREENMTTSVRIQFCETILSVNPFISNT